MSKKSPSNHFGAIAGEIAESEEYSYAPRVYPEISDFLIREHNLSQYPDLEMALELYDEDVRQASENYEDPHVHQDAKWGAESSISQIEEIVRSEGLTLERLKSLEITEESQQSSQESVENSLNIEQDSTG